MASKTASRYLQSFVQKIRPICNCARFTSSRSVSLGHISTSVSRKEVQYDTDQAERPRWSYTPERMKAPYPYRIRDTEKKWDCNSDPAKLDQFYIKFLGRGGDKVLTDEIKWLSITHKSFDQGRRGFNDRLAFFGMILVGFEIDYFILSSMSI